MERGKSNSTLVTLNELVKLSNNEFLAGYNEPMGYTLINKPSRL